MRVSLPSANILSSRKIDPGLRSARLKKGATALTSAMVTRIGPKHPFRLYLKEWREKKRLTQQQVADRIETSKGVVANWENSKRQLNVGALAAYAEALGISPDRLYQDPEKPSVDQLLSGVDDKTRELAAEMVETLVKRAQR